MQVAKKQWQRRSMEMVNERRKRARVTLGFGIGRCSVLALAQWGLADEALAVAAYEELLQEYQRKAERHSQAHTCLREGVEEMLRLLDPLSTMPGEEVTARQLQVMLQSQQGGVLQELADEVFRTGTDGLFEKWAAHKWADVLCGMWHDMSVAVVNMGTMQLLMIMMARDPRTRVPEVRIPN